MKYELLERHFFRSIGFSSSSKTFVAGDQLETWERQETRYVILEGVARKLSAYSDGVLPVFLWVLIVLCFCLVQVIRMLFILN